MKQTFSDLKVPLVLVAVIGLCAALALPIMPIDETRYLSVAWDMWTHHSFVVPLLNGLPYSHKPPFLFWMMHAGWALFGVNDVTPRLIPGIFSFLNLMLVYRIGLRLWPQERKAAILTSLVLASTAIWVAWSVAIMFDMVLTFWILLGLLGTLRATEGQRGGWVLLTAGVAGGLLTKGPAVFVYLLSIPLLRAWWDVRRESPVRAKWYLGVLGAALVGFAIALIWVIPAAIQGGEVYRQEILWGQTVDRMTSSFAHRRPLWWYLPILPLYFFPWVLFPASYKKCALKKMDTGTRFCLTWMLLPLLIFSFVSGKQVHYLVPFIPAGVLLIGQNIARAQKHNGRIAVKILGGFFLLLGLIALALPLISMGGDIGQMEAGDTRFAALGLLIAGLFLMLPFRSTAITTKRLALCMALIFLCSLVEAKKNFMDDYDLKDTAEFIKGKMDEGLAVAHIGKYHGQFQFTGRLTKPIASIQETKPEIIAFDAAHPDAVFISYRKDKSLLLDRSVPIFTHEYRGKEVVLWTLGPESMED